MNQPSSARFVRRHTGRRAAILAFAIVLAIGVSGQSIATTIVPMDMGDLVGLSRAVAVVTIESKQSRWDDSQTQIFTEYQVGVERVLKDPTQTLPFLRALGGTVGDITMRASGIPDFEIGDRAVLFLDTDPSGLFPVVGWQTGVFRVTESPTGPAMFTHDWRPVVGVEHDKPVLGPSLVAHAEDGEARSVQARRETMQRAIAVAPSCISLDGFLDQVDRIVTDQKVHGFTWRYARFLKPLDRQQVGDGAPEQTVTVTEPALPSPQDE